MKFINFLCLSLFLFVLFGCDDSQLFTEADIYEIAEEKYGKVQPIIKNINFFKYLKDDLPVINGLDYLISKSVIGYGYSPDMRNSLMFQMDLVVHENKYQLLMYNRTIRQSADKHKMVLLNDWFFEASIIDIISALDDNQIVYDDPNDWQMEVIKRPADPYPYSLWGSLIDMVYLKENPKVLIYLNNFKTDEIELVASKDLILIGDFSKKEIIYPESIKYDDYKKINFQIELDIPSNKTFGLTIIRNQDQLINFLNNQHLKDVSSGLKNMDFDLETLIVFPMASGLTVDSLNIRTFETLIFQTFADQQSKQNHIYFITIKKLDKEVVVFVNNP